tara:strand:+ start:168 stop:812 length:645 start_codon:yes stop_codon:yes gene_type:complete
MDPVIVTATKVKTKDTKATYASEVYNREDIEKSGAVTIFDFLNNNTSTAILPNWGNQYEQNIDIRGFGFTEGFKNVAITVNGRRLNNIDSVPQKLIDIGINTIDRIEITKGSGSIVHGDGATGGPSRSILATYTIQWLRLQLVTMESILGHSQLVWQKTTIYFLFQAVIINKVVLVIQARMVIKIGEILKIILQDFNIFRQNRANYILKKNMDM